MSENSKIELEEKIFYFLVIFEREKSENNPEFKFINIKNPPICIFTTKDEKQKNNLYKKIYKYIIPKEYILDRKLIINALIGDDQYTIDFPVKEGLSFIYDINLKVTNKLYKYPSDIEQNIIKYYEKLNMYIECLSQNNEDEKLDILYKNTIALYSKKPQYILLIKLFTKVYQDRDLCLSLLDKFIETNDKETLFNNIGNDNLESLKDTFKEILENADNLISKNSFKKEYAKYFYSIILSFLNNYDYNNFLELIDKLYKSDKEILFDILLDYKSCFKNEIKKDINFFNEFIGYCTTKTYTEFFYNGLFYLKNIHDYLKVLYFNREKIILIKKFIPIKILSIENNIQLNINDIRDLIEKIISFSEKNKISLLYITKNFWEKIISNYSLANQEHIIICDEMRKLYYRYYNFVISLNDKNLTKIIEEVRKICDSEFYERLLDKNIKKYIQNEKNIDNIKIIDLIVNRDAFYSIESNEKYKNRRDLKIFDKIDFDNIDDKFIRYFHDSNFELLFEHEIQNFLIHFFSKVKTINHIDIILKLIKAENLKQNKDIYIQLLIQKYDELLDKGSLFKTENESLAQIVTIFGRLINFLYKNQNSLDFISKKIFKLDEKMKDKIYIELIQYFNENECKQLAEYIIEIYFKNLEKGKIEELINFLDKLQINYKKNLLEKINDAYLIEPKDFYNKGYNLKIELLCKLIESNTIEENNDYFNSSKEILKEIYAEFDEKKITIEHLKTFLSNNENIILERLKLFKLLENVDYENLLDQSKTLINEINDTKNQLNYIKEQFESYHKEVYKDKINEIRLIFKLINESTIEDYNNNKFQINKILANKNKADNINKVKNSKIFNIFYDKANTINDQEERFNSALKNYEKFVNGIKEKPDIERINIKNIIKELKEQIRENDIIEIVNEINKKIKKKS
jgi:hypothetical protein